MLKYLFKIQFVFLSTKFKKFTLKNSHYTALEYTGGVPYDLLKPVLNHATPEQLLVLEHYNPYLVEDTDELWEFHCKKRFRTKVREDMETWREMFMVCSVI